MTVAARPASVSYLEDGQTVSFPAPFRFKSARDLVVERIRFDSTVVRLQLGVDYTVSGGATDAGGTVTRTAAASGATLRIRRFTARAQLMTYTTGDRFPATSHEEALDQQMLVSQEQDATIEETRGRALMLPAGETSIDLPVASERAQSALVFDSLGRPVAKPIGSFPAGPAGAANNTYTSYTALLASDPDRKYAYLSGDTDTPPRPDGAYSNPTGRPGAWVRPEDQVSVAFAGAVATTIGNGPDAAPAIRAAIQLAATSGTGVVTLPGHFGFIYRCDTPIWDTRVHGPFPRNLRFTGLARNPNGYVGGPSIRYTGKDTLFFLNFDTGNDECGNYSFNSLTFEATDPAATIFDWNDPTHYFPGDGDGKAYVRGVVYDRCHFYGPQAGVIQTGDAIRAAKVFDLDIKKGCYFRGWRRGTWPKACDNLRYDARSNYNCRNLMLEGVAPFSSGAHVNTEWIGEVVAGSEPSYPIWDSAIGAKYFGPLVEQITSGIATALIYLNGVGTQLWGFGGAGAPMFRLGPNARDIDWYCPSVPQNDAYAPIIDAPVNDQGAINWDFGDPQQQRCMRVHGADLKAQMTLGRNGRIQYRNQSRGQGAIPSAQDLQVDGVGVRNRQTVVTALDYWGKSNGTVHSGGVQLVADDNAFGRWAIRLVNGQASAGFVMSLRVGDQIHAERLLLRIDARVTAGGGYGFTVRRNGTITAIVGLTFAGGGYSPQDTVLDFSGFAIGDTIEIGIGAVGPTSGDMFVNAAVVGPINPAIPDLAVIDGNTTLPNLIAYINNTIIPAINAHNAVERRFMRIGV